MWPGLLIRVMALGCQVERCKAPSKGQLELSGQAVLAWLRGGGQRERTGQTGEKPGRQRAFPHPEVPGTPSTESVLEDGS